MLQIHENLISSILFQLRYGYTGTHLCNKIHGFVFDPNNSATINQMANGKTPVDWIPWFWNLSGEPYFSALDSEFNPEPWVIEMTLMEVKPTKQMSSTNYILNNGNCKLREGGISKEDVFATFTLTVEVEEGSFDKVYHVKQ